MFRARFEAAKGLRQGVLDAVVDEKHIASGEGRDIRV
jgi:hypothetical protein